MSLFASALQCAHPNCGRYEGEHQSWNISPGYDGHKFVPQDITPVEEVPVKEEFL